MHQRIIDTCCLLNLFASGEPKAILHHHGGMYMSEQVSAEALSIREIDRASPELLIPKKIDLTECIDDGAITVCRLEQESEFELFVQLAQQLDDGEASALAIAQVRGLTVATDDRKARRVANTLSIPTISTSQMIQSWTNSESMSDSQISNILRNIQRFGRFVPRESDPLYLWWMQLVELTIE